MPKITKTALMEEALKKYSPSKIEEATHCEVKVKLKKGSAFGGGLGLKLPLNSRGKKSKADKIRTGIRSLLLNRQDNEDRRFYGDTSSDNIESINISLKFK